MLREAQTAHTVIMADSGAAKLKGRAWREKAQKVVDLLNKQGAKGHTLQALEVLRETQTQLTGASSAVAHLQHGLGGALAPDGVLGWTPFWWSCVTVQDRCTSLPGRAQTLRLLWPIASSGRSFGCTAFPPGLSDRDAKLTSNYRRCVIRLGRGWP